MAGKRADDRAEEALETFRSRVLRCPECRGAEAESEGPPPKVLGRGLLGAALMLVGEAPGAKEEESGRPFVGTAGRILRQALFDLGLEPEEQVYLTNLIPIRVYRLGRTGKKHNVPSPRELQEHGLTHLLEEIEIVRPKIVGLLGNIPAKLFVPRGFLLSRDHGSVFETRGLTVIPTYHPSAVLRNPFPRNQEIKERLFADIRKMAELAGLL